MELPFPCFSAKSTRCVVVATLFQLGNRRLFAGTHHYDFNRACGGRHACCLIVLKLTAGDGIRAASVLSVEIDLDVVKEGLAVALHGYGASGVNLKDRLAFACLRVVYAVSLLFDIDAQAFGQILAKKVSGPLTGGQKDQNRGHQQPATNQQQRA
jgi:hypothetical protein